MTDLCPHGLSGKEICHHCEREKKMRDKITVLEKQVSDFVECEIVSVEWFNEGSITMIQVEIPSAMRWGYRDKMKILQVEAL